MSTEEMTAEESAALEAMETDAAPVEGKPAEPAPEENPAEATEEASKPAEGEPAFKSTQADQKPPEGFVPHQAMHAERVKRQETEKRVEALEAQLAAMQKPADEPPQWVDPLIDPEGFRKYSEHQQQGLANQLDAITKATQAQTQQQQQFQQVMRAEAEFAAKTPDYTDVIQGMANARTQELAGLGYAQPEIQAQIQKDAQAIFNAAQAMGMNPAELAYMRAKNMGIAPSHPAPAQPTDAEKVTALAEAKKQTQGLGDAGGEQSGKLTASQLADMSEEELQAVPEAELRRIMGG